MPISLEEAQAKAHAYGTGIIPVSNLPPNQPHKSHSGFCDYCNKERPVVMEIMNRQYFVCWLCICKLKEIHGEQWEIKVKDSLFRNRQLRLQLAAQKAAQRKGGGQYGQFG